MKEKSKSNQNENNSLKKDKNIIFGSIINDKIIIEIERNDEFF